MLQDLNTMNKDIDTLLGKVHEGETIYPEYVGCIERSSSMRDGFTRQNLLDAGFEPDDVEDYVNIVDTLWDHYIKMQIQSKMTPDAEKATL